MAERFPAVGRDIAWRGTKRLHPNGIGLRPFMKRRQSAAAVAWAQPQAPSVSTVDLLDCHWNSSLVAQSNFTLHDAWLDHNKRQLNIHYTHGLMKRRARFPYIWLQDNCRSQENWHASAHSRKSHLDQLIPKLKPSQVSTEADTVNVEWENGHKSPFTVQFLHNRTFPDDREGSKFLEYHDDMGMTQSWNSNHEFKKLDFNDVMTKDSAMAEWMRTLWKDGVVILQNAPQADITIEESSGACENTETSVTPTRVLKEFIQRVAFARATSYGTYFNVFMRLAPANAAYTSGNLAIHTDMPGYKNAPDIQLLHCIQQSSNGGRSLLVDGYAIAEELQREYPRLYDCLTHTLIDFREYGKDPSVGWFDLHSQHRIINLDEQGRHSKIVYSNHQRASHLQLPLDDVELFYEALMKWNELLYDDRFLKRHRLENDDVLCFNNLRVLHGREAYEQLPGETRWLQGAYLEWDDVRSRYRAMRDVYGPAWDDAL